MTSTLFKISTIIDDRLNEHVSIPPFLPALCLTIAVLPFIVFHKINKVKLLFAGVDVERCFSVDP